MRWSIRWQILTPFLTIVAMSIGLLTVLSLWQATRREAARTRERLQAVVETLTGSNMPLTESVLSKMRGLSGAEFVVVDAEAEILAGTLSGLKVQTGLSVPGVKPATTGDTSSAAVVSPVSLEQWPNADHVLIEGQDYLLARVAVPPPPAGRTLFVLYPAEKWAQARWDAAWPSLAVGTLATLVSLISGGWLAERMSRRIRRLQQGTAEVAEGRFQTRIADHGRDELHELAEAVNRMAERLQRLQESIRDHERRQLLSQLAGGLAHQLRNAVAGARLALQLHQRRCPAGETDQSLRVALRQLSLTETELRGLLSLGRGAAAPRELVAIQTLLDDLRELVSASAEHAGTQLDVPRCPDGLQVRLDLDGVRGAVLNLLLNGLSAAGPGGVVRLEAQVEQEAILLLVTDSGRGPPAGLEEAMFQPFVTTKPDGVGIGLSLAREVAIAHGGGLDWRRTAEGTEFRLRLAVAEEDRTAAESQRRTDLVGSPA